MEGKSKLSLPPEELRALAEKEGNLFSTSPNHWSDLESLKLYFFHVLSPYFKEQKKQLGLRDDHPAIVILDCWSVHKSESFRTFVERSFPWMHLLFVPACCTSKFQPCDLSLQKAFKSAWTDLGILHILRQIDKQQEAGVAPEEIDIDLRVQVRRLPTQVVTSHRWPHHSVTDNPARIAPHPL